MADYTTIALVVGIAMALIRIIESLLAYAFKNGKKADTKQDVRIAVIEERLSNCLPTIERRLEKIENKINKIYEMFIKVP